MVNAKEMALAAAKALDSKKGRDIKVLEIDKITTLADYFVICSGHKGSAQVPTEDEMRNIQGAKSRADAARRGKLDDIIKELLKEDM